MLASYSCIGTEAVVFNLKSRIVDHSSKFSMAGIRIMMTFSRKHILCSQIKVQ